MQRPYFHKKIASSQVLGVRTSTSLRGGHNSTHRPFLGVLWISSLQHGMEFFLFLIQTPRMDPWPLNVSETVTPGPAQHLRGWDHLVALTLMKAHFLQDQEVTYTELCTIQTSSTKDSHTLCLLFGMPPPPSSGQILFIPQSHLNCPLGKSFPTDPLPRLSSVPLNFISIYHMCN